MSRRAAPNPAAERAAQNQATIKNLLKLEPNKVCADCKRNKHPRWASWNLGVFVCIRCSGIHRGMGTHISRVKSVDLDSWTDEQLQSVLNWGNARANKYWEAKLAAGHAPSESKIENFIRTKYELKRWTMDGPIPDPSTLDADGDDEVPLSLVKEKQVIDKKETERKISIGKAQAPRGHPSHEVDLIGGGDLTPSRSGISGTSLNTGLKAAPAAPKTTSTKDSLLGLDFLGEPTAPPRPASTPGTAAPGNQSRPDLKQSILSLYASVPRPQPQQQQNVHQQQNVNQQHNVHQQQGSFGGLGSSNMGYQQQQGSAGGFNDAFSNLSMSSTTSPRPASSDPFANLGSGSSSSRFSPPVSNNSNAFGSLGGGSFFDNKPTQTAHQKQPSNSGFGDFAAFTSPAPKPATVPAQPKPAPASSAMGDLFDLSSPVTNTTSPPPTSTFPPPPSNSVFNLSSPQTKPAAPTTNTTTTSSFGGGGFSGADVWGSNEWNTPETAAPAPPAAQKSPGIPKPPSNSMGWGNSGAFAQTPIAPPSTGGFGSAPKVTADEEFGGWASSTAPPATGGSTGGSGKPAGGLDEDLFSNVWQ